MKERWDIELCGKKRVVTPRVATRLKPESFGKWHNTKSSHSFTHLRISIIRKPLILISLSLTLGMDSGLCECNLIQGVLMNIKRRVQLIWVRQPIHSRLENKLSLLTSLTLFLYDCCFSFLFLSISNHRNVWCLTSDCLATFWHHPEIEAQRRAVLMNMNMHEWHILQNWRGCLWLYSYTRNSNKPNSHATVLLDEKAGTREKKITIKMNLNC